MDGNFAVKLIRGTEEITLDVEDIIELNLVENIFNFCMSGSITFYDKVGWTEYFEAVGFDPIAVIWQESKIEKKKLFNVYHYEALVEEAQLDTGIRKAKWYFMEPLYTSLTTRRYSKAWGEGVDGTTIITDIGKNMLGIEKYEQFENTRETFDNFYMPYWTPAEAIKWIMKRCSGENSQMPGYLWYSNSLEHPTFTTIESLLTNTVREKDSSENPVKYVFSGQGDDSNKILSWYVQPPDMSSVNYLCGAKRHGYTFDSKRIIQSDFDYKTLIGKSSLLGRSTLYRDLSEVNTNVTIDCESDQTILNNIQEGDFINRYIRQLVAGLVVRGESRRYAGMIIDIEWKSSDSKQITDKMMEGLWLVKSITHQFTTGVNASPPYRQLLVCIKGGYNNSEAGQLMLHDKSKVVSDTYTQKK